MAVRGILSLTDRRLLRVAGEGSASFLNGLCSQETALVSERGAIPAAFLSAKGRVLCDTILVSAGGHDIFVDCHRDVATPLLRLLLRHRLRERLTIDDVSDTHRVLAIVPSEAAVAPLSSPMETEVPDCFFPDPRFAALGHRAVLDHESAAAFSSEDEHDPDAGLSLYHLWRLCCAVPEGPGDLPTDSMMPLHGNLDLLNFISFSKGCYVGQENTTRVKHRGAVRRRFFSVASAADGHPQQMLDSLELSPSAPLPPAALLQRPGPKLPGVVAPLCLPSEAKVGEELRAVFAQGVTKSVGTVYSARSSIGLCLLRSEGSFNDAEAFQNAPLPAGSLLSTAGGIPLGLRPPPYVFSSE